VIDGWDKKVDYHDKSTDAEKIGYVGERIKPVQRLPSKKSFLKNKKKHLCPPKKS